MKVWELKELLNKAEDRYVVVVADSEDCRAEITDARIDRDSAFEVVLKIEKELCPHPDDHTC